MPAKPAPEEHHLTGVEIDNLPFGSVVIDSEDDTYTRTNGAQGTLVHDSHHTHWYGGEVEGQYGPVRLVSTPPTDPYQEARLALRDVLGMEPDEQMIRNTMALNEASPDMPLSANASRVAHATIDDAAGSATKSLTALYTEEWVNADFGVVVFVNDNDVAGLARLRAHSALDALLDQHGISR